MSTLAELLQLTGPKIRQLPESLEINHRTIQRRIREPESFTPKEVLALSKLLSVCEDELGAPIRDKCQRQLVTPAGSATASATEQP